MTDPVAPSVRTRFRAHVESLVELHPEMNSGELADLVGRSLPDFDRELVVEFLSTEARNILAWEMRTQFVRTRQGIYGVLDLANPDAPQLSDLEEDKKATLYERITQWREFVPSENRSWPLLQLTKSMLLESAGYDAGIMFLHGWKMQLKNRLAACLPEDDFVVVGDRFTPEQVYELGETIKKEMGRGSIRLKVAPIHALSRTRPVPRQGDGRNAEGPQDH